MKTLDTIEIDPMGKILETDDELGLYQELELYQGLLDQALVDCSEMIEKYINQGVEMDMEALREKNIDIEVYKGLIFTCKQLLAIMLSKPL